MGGNAADDDGNACMGGKDGLRVNDRSFNSLRHRRREDRLAINHQQGWRTGHWSLGMAHEMRWCIGYRV